MRISIIVRIDNDISNNIIIYSDNNNWQYNSIKSITVAD